MTTMNEEKENKEELKFQGWDNNALQIPFFVFPALNKEN